MMKTVLVRRGHKAAANREMEASDSDEDNSRNMSDEEKTREGGGAP